MSNENKTKGWAPMNIKMETLQQIKELRNLYGFKSYDETLVNLIRWSKALMLIRKKRTLK